MVFMRGSRNSPRRVANPPGRVPTYNFAKKYLKLSIFLGRYCIRFSLRDWRFNDTTQRWLSLIDTTKLVVSLGPNLCSIIKEIELSFYNSSARSHLPFLFYIWPDDYTEVYLSLQKSVEVDGLLARQGIGSSGWKYSTAGWVR